MTKQASKDHVTVSPEEFVKIEHLLGRLLQNSDEREQVLILQIHQRVSRMKDAYSAEQNTLDYLRDLAS